MLLVAPSLAQPGLELHYYKIHEALQKDGDRKYYFIYVLEESPPVVRVYGRGDEGFRYSNG